MLRSYDYHPPNKALELTADSRCGLASEFSDYFESQFGGSCFCSLGHSSALDFRLDLSQSIDMDFPSLFEALSEHYGEGADIELPEDETEAWRAIVQDCDDGLYPGLLRETEQLLRRSDQEVFTFLRACAPAWECHSPADARHSLTVFQSYVETYSH